MSDWYNFSVYSYSSRSAKNYDVTCTVCSRESYHVCIVNYTFYLTVAALFITRIKFKTRKYVNTRFFFTYFKF